MENQEITDIVYDTLMDNGKTGRILETADVFDQEVDAKEGIISFLFHGRKVTIVISSEEL